MKQEPLRTSYLKASYKVYRSFMQDLKQAPFPQQEHSGTCPNQQSGRVSIYQKHKSLSNSFMANHNLHIPVRLFPRFPGGISVDVFRSFSLTIGLWSQKPKDESHSTKLKIGVAIKVGGLWLNG